MREVGQIAIRVSSDCAIEKNVKWIGENSKKEGKERKIIISIVQWKHFLSIYISTHNLFSKMIRIFFTSPILHGRFFPLHTKQNEKKKHKNFGRWLLKTWNKRTIYCSFSTLRVWVMHEREKWKVKKMELKTVRILTASKAYV